jgi:phage protein D
MADPIFDQPRNMPGFKVLVGGNALPDDTALDILTVQVCTYVEGASMFSVAFNNWHSRQQDFKWIDVDLLREGTELEVQVGFVDAFKTLIVGEVTSLEPEFPVDGVPILNVHGYDRLHRFRRGRKTRSFTNMKDSQIAEQIARDLQLRAQVEDTQVTHDYLLQHNQTDIDFLLERARRMRYEVTVQDNTLHFRKAANNQSQVITLEYGRTLQAFYPRLSTVQQASEVVVQGWNPKTKEAIVASARAGDEVSTMGGTTLGATLSERAFFATKWIIVDTPIVSQGEALQIAKGKFNEMLVAFITGEGTAIGNTDIRAGEVLELQGLGQRFSGLYYVTSAAHNIDQSGYTTTFTVERNAT